MPISDYIKETLNVSDDEIEDMSIVRKDDTFYTYISLKPTYPNCPLCGYKTKRKGIVDFKFKTLPINGLSHEVIWKRRVYKCLDKTCKFSFREDNRFTPGSLHYSFSLLNDLGKDLANLHYTYKDLADKHNMSLSSVELYADSLLNIPRLRLPKNLGIDELSSDMAKYGSSYLCVMADNNSRSLHEILPSRSKRELSKYFESIPPNERKYVEYVTIDMWLPYKDVCKRYLPNCQIACDNFHVVKELVSCFDRFRIDIMNRYDKGTINYYLLKNCNWLFDSIDINLDNEPKFNHFFRQKMNKRDLYEIILRVNPSLTKAYYLKEDYRRFNKEATPENANVWFDKILAEFIEADLACYRSFIITLKNWKEEIINSFNRPYNNRKESNALTEYFNGRIGEYINISNGLSNFDRFRSRCLYALNSSINYSISSHLKSKKKVGLKRDSYNTKKDIDIKLKESTDEE